MPKTLSDIIPPSRRRAMEASVGPSQNDSYEPPRNMRSRGKGFPWGYAVIALIVLLVCFGALMVFAGASVTVTPTVNETSVQGEWTATPSTGELPFEVVSVDKIVSQSVPAEGTETATVAAQGSVTIFNAQDKVQELIKNTRFESPDGKIYRIHDSITVPAGSTAAPGTLKVTVYADAAGESYNIAPTTFTLPGLKNSDLFELVYAKSDEPMVGGFTGTRPSVNQTTRDATYEKMKGTLTTDLHTLVAEKVPEGYVLIPGATFVMYTAQPDTADSSSSVNVQYKGSATAFIFPNESLARALAYSLVARYDGQPAMIQSTEGLTFSAVGEDAPTAGIPSLTFNLSGTTAIVWSVDPANIAGAIAGKSRDAARTILNGFPEIEEASIVLRPFWDSTLPSDPTKIEVKVKEPKTAD